LYLFDVDIQRHSVSVQSTDMFAKYRKLNSPRNGFPFDTPFYVSRRSSAKNDPFIKKIEKHDLASKGFPLFAHSQHVAHKDTKRLISPSDLLALPI